jgi:hypothetical protein
MRKRDGCSWYNSPARLFQVIHGSGKNLETVTPAGITRKNPFLREENHELW